MAGDFKNPIAVDTYKNLYKCLDDDFYLILSMYKWFETGLYKIDLNNIPYKVALGLKYLIEYNEILKKDYIIG